MVRFTYFRHLCFCFFDYNRMQILDTLKGLNNVELSALVSEILNYNRFKSSSLGYARGFTPNPEIQRNIIA